MNKIEVGGRYTSVNGDKWECVAIKGDVAWLACMDAYGEVSGAAYSFNLDGTHICLNGNYNIKFAPVVETVNVKCSISETFQPGSFFNMSVGFIDGKPDWSTAKVTGA